MKKKLKYLFLALKILFLTVVGAVIYHDREALYRFCRYPFPFIMCPTCDYPCFFYTYRFHDTIVWGVVITGLVGGRVFCGICPVGTIQDWLHSLKRLIFSLFHSLKRLIFSSNVLNSKGSAANLEKPQRILGRGLRFLKYPFLLLVFTYSLIRFAQAHDFMPEWGLIPAMHFTLQVREVAGRGHWNVWLLFLVTVFGVGLALHRPWCKYLCPYGLLFAVLNKISFLKIKLEKKDCTGCGMCLKDCTTGKPHSKLEEGFVSAECVRCYNCALDCSEGAAKLKFRFSK